MEQSRDDAAQLAATMDFLGRLRNNQVSMSGEQHRALMKTMRELLASLSPPSLAPLPANLKFPERRALARQQRAEHEHYLLMQGRTGFHRTLSPETRRFGESDNQAPLVFLHCYVCGELKEPCHSHYLSMCVPCGEFNFRKRNQSTNLSGRIAVVTGGRIKIGFEIVRKLLTAGARVILTTRFPEDAERRVATLGAELAARCRVEELDLLDEKAVEEFGCLLRRDYDSGIDYLIHNAAQTIRRPEGFGTQAEGEGWDSDPITGEPRDLREMNSWRLTLEETSGKEIHQVLQINAGAPARLTGLLLPLLRAPHGHVVCVSAAEGQFFRRNKTEHHVATNMGKAALNMLVRTVGQSANKVGVKINAVDTGWITQESPRPRALALAARGLVMPLDVVDGAARVLDPIFSCDSRVGCFFQNYRPAPW